MATRKSTPKYEIYHIASGVVALSGISKTDAIKTARAMNKGCTKKRIAVRPVKRETV